MHKDDVISVQVNAATIMHLMEFLKRNGSARSIKTVIEEAIQYWTDNAEWKKEDLMPEVYFAGQGFYWAALFLPHGTKVRMRFREKFYYAEVRGDELRYEKNALTPSQFANLIGQTNRNAKDCLEIMRPDDGFWYKAKDLHGKHIDVSPSKEKQKDIKYTFLGREYPEANQNAVYISILKQLHHRDAGFFDKLSKEVRGRTRGHISKIKAEVYPGRADLLQYVENVDDWYVGTNISRREKIIFIKKACLVSNLEFGKDIRIDW